MILTEIGVSQDTWVVILVYLLVELLVCIWCILEHTQQSNIKLFAMSNSIIVVYTLNFGVVNCDFFVMFQRCEELYSGVYFWLSRVVFMMFTWQFGKLRMLCTRFYLCVFKLLLQLYQTWRCPLWWLNQFTEIYKAKCNLLKESIQMKSYLF